ncbi:hypothetical protein AAMO2058_001483400 [Amorphochlora amoebiformis]
MCDCAFAFRCDGPWGFLQAKETIPTLQILFGTTHNPWIRKRMRSTPLTSNLPESDSLKVFGEARISGQVYVVELKMVDKTYHLKTGTEDSWEVFLGRVSAVTGIESDRLRLINMNKSVYRDTYTHYGPTNKFFGYPVYIITRLRNTSASARSEPKPAQSKQ